MTMRLTQKEAYEMTSRFTFCVGNMMGFVKKACVFFVCFLSSTQSFSYFLTGSGHYSARTVYQRNPDLTKASNHFSFNQSFRLLGEFRAHERASFFAEIRMFEKLREARMGQRLSETRDIFYPRYHPLAPTVTKLYMNFVTDYVIFDVGRRPRTWAQGLLYDAGDKPFSTYQSVYDGFTAYLNPSKSQSLGFMAGYDLLHDSKGVENQRFFNQIFGAVHYDTIKLDGAGPVATNTGLYFAHQFDSGFENDNVSGTALSYCDAYFNFFFRPINLEWKNEVLGVWGKSAGSRLEKLGGGIDANEKESHGSFSVATNLTLSFLESGSFHGPKEFMKGTYRRHLAFFDFVFLPGSSEGGKGAKKRDKGMANAFKANPNFKKTLILFNGRENLDSEKNLNVDGIFDPYRMTNVFLYSVGYRYEDLSIGNIEGRFSYAMMHKSQEDASDKVGYKSNGTTIGFEADLSYSLAFGKSLEIGADLGILVPGAALKAGSTEAKTSILAQATVVFNL